jgi:hypothetical protein
MKIIYSAILMLGYLFGQIASIPIIYLPGPKENTNLDPAIVVTRPTKPILYVNENDTAIVPPPPAPPGPINFDEIEPVEILGPVMSDTFVLPDGQILYTPKDITPFLA